MQELEIVQYPQLDGLRLFLNTVYYRTPHLHSEWELILVLENTLFIRSGQANYLVEPGQMILFNPDEPHEFQRTDGGCTFACMQVSQRILPVSTWLHVEGCLLHRYLSPEEMEDITSLFLNVLRKYLRQEEQYALYCVAQCCMIFYRLLSKVPSRELTPAQAAHMDKRNTLLKRLVKFVDDNYTTKIRLSDFAEAEGYTVSYLSHYIKTSMNQTFQGYVTSVRLNCARNMIAAGRKRMLDICMESGFSDYRYFCKAFRKQYNMTPETYRHSNSQSKRLSVLRCSIHSEEKFYSWEDSLMLLEDLLRRQ